MPGPATDNAEPTLTDLAGLLAPEDDTGGGGERGNAQDEGQTPAPPADDDDDGTPADDAGTDDAKDDADDGADGDDAGNADDEPSTEPTYTVKIDGKDTPVTLKEALAGYQRNADYTRKTMEVAEARKAIEAETAAAREQREQYAAILKVVQDRLGAADQEPTAEQWNALRASDPARYATEWTDYQRREQQRNAVKAEQDRLAEAGRQETLVKARTYINGERTKLAAAIPDFGDTAKGPAKMKALREYAAKTFGYSDAEMDQAYDHRMIVAIDKAAQWDAHQAAIVAAKAKVKTAPELPAPGSRVPGKSSKQVARVAAQKQFDKSGHIDDAVALLLA